MKSIDTYIEFAPDLSLRERVRVLDVTSLQIGDSRDSLSPFAGNTKMNYL